MDEQLIQTAKEIIEKIIYISLATTTPEGNPWNSPVYAAYDKLYNFYWRSPKDAVHSQNIKNNASIFITIYDTTIPWGEGKGVYIQAKATELTNKNDINYALALLDKRSPKSLGNADTFLNDFPRRVYKATPQKIWINADEKIDGQFIDKRVAIQLF